MIVAEAVAKLRPLRPPRHFKFFKLNQIFVKYLLEMVAGKITTTSLAAHTYKVFDLKESSRVPEILNWETITCWPRYISELKGRWNVKCIGSSSVS